LPIPRTLQAPFHMVLRLIIGALLAGTAAAASPCLSSSNSDTNSAKECKYLSPCTVETNDIPTAATGYQIECETMPCPANQDIMYDRIEGTDIGVLMEASCSNTVAACSALCETTTGCCGFNFVFNPGQSDSQTVGRCVAKACDGRIGSSRYGMVYYKRSNGAVSSSASSSTSSGSSSSSSTDVEVILWDVTASGQVSDISESDDAAIRSGIATAAGVGQASYVSTAYMSASVKLYATISIPAGMTADAVKSSVDGNLGTPSIANTYFGQALSVQSVDSITKTTATAATDTIVNAGATTLFDQFNNFVAKATGLAIGLLIAIIVAPVVVVLCLVSLLIYCCCCRNRRKTTVTATNA